MVARKLVRNSGMLQTLRDLHSNQGTNFGSKVVAEVCQLFGIHKTRMPPYHPRSDGFIESSFHTLGHCLKAACRETRREWDELVQCKWFSFPYVILHFPRFAVSMARNLLGYLDYNYLEGP